MARGIPDELYSEVFALATAIVQPLADSEEHVDDAMASDAYAKLVALYEHHERTGTPHPFLAETLADFTSDDTKAIVLYQHALDQCADFPDEPRSTKRIALAKRLHATGRTAEAREQLALARQDAFAEHDTTTMAEMDEFASLLS